MTRTGAHVEIIAPGPASRLVCEACDIVTNYGRTAPAQDAARAHNVTEHAFPEQPLDHTDTEETA